MQTLDFSGMIVVYNLVIGVLIMLSSEKIASFAGNLSRMRHDKIARITQVSTFAFGACVSALSAAIYLAFHLLKIGV